MDARTREALEASIKHWEKNVSEPVLATLGPYDCPLCKQFNPVCLGIHKDAGCVGCPVMQRTGQSFCDGSPFWDAQTAEDNGDEEAFLHAIQAELDFLRSLLPSEQEA